MSSYQKQDTHYHRAKREGFLARSVYKLQELDRRFGLLRSGYRVLDLGAAPGSWSQYALQRVGPSGRLVGIDLEPVGLTHPQAEFLQVSIEDWARERGEKGARADFDLVLSDMAPKTTGIRTTDQARSLHLCEIALHTAVGGLMPGGAFACKIFEGPDLQELKKEFRHHFSRLEILRPGATRERSMETYWIGLGFRVVS